MNAQAQQTQGGAEAVKSNISLSNQTPGIDISKLFVSTVPSEFTVLFPVSVQCSDSVCAEMSSVCFHRHSYANINTSRNNHNQTIK